MKKAIWSLAKKKKGSKEVWELYFRELFHDVRVRQEPIVEDNTGPVTLPEEITAAIKEMKHGQATRLDQVPTETIR